MQNAEYLTDIINIVSEIMKKRGWKGYLVGGYVRDLLLSRETNDIDIAVKGDSRRIAEQIASDTGSKYVLLDDENKVARVVLKQGSRQLYLDFSSFSRNIEEDLSRRDFTVNAMAIDINGININSLIDPFGGLDDLLNRLIRAVKKDVFKSDPSRLLRAVRFKYLLDFDIDPATEKLITKDSSLAGSVAGEKTREELMAILVLPDCYKALCHMDRLNLLRAIIPEIEELKGVEQPKEHYWDVFDHTMETVACTSLLLREKDWEYDPGILADFTPWDEDIRRHFNRHIASDSNHRQLLKLAALLHDIAKPPCKTFEKKTGRMRFLGHAKDGSITAADILNRLRFSNKEIKAVELMVYNHLRPAQMSNTGMPTAHAIYRYFRDTGEFGLDILFLELADFLASQGPKLDIGEWQAHTDISRYIWKQHREQVSEEKTVKLLDGNDLMKEFGLEPGPQFGKLLALIEEAQATGKIRIREQALEMVGRKISKAGKKK